MKFSNLSFPKIFQEEPNDYLKQFGKDLKSKIDSLYRESINQIYSNSKSLFYEEKIYLAVKFGYYQALKNDNYLDYDIAYQIVKEHSSLIGEMLPFCQTKEQQSSLVKMSMDTQDNHLFIIKKYPHLLNNYIEENCSFKTESQATDFLCFDNGKKQICIAKEDFVDMKNDVMRHKYNSNKYMPVEKSKYCVENVMQA